MIILRESDYITVPWKNGGGVTQEILRAPAEPTAFDWRLSLAAIDSPGPFSVFDGYQRALVLVRGAGIELSFGRHGRTRLTAPGQMVSFDGSWPTSCTLVDGRSTDLNLIVSTQRAESASRCVRLETPQIIQTAGWSDTLVCCISGAIRLTNSAGEAHTLHGVDVARCSPEDGPLGCSREGSGAATVFLASIRPRDT